MSRTHITAGIDPGSSTVKVAVVRSRAGEDAEVLASEVRRIRRRDVREVTEAAFAAACTAAGVDREELDYVATTGDGESLPFRTGHFYSITTHARGAIFIAPEARAALDVGALHARALRVDPRGKVLNHRMTSQCASGTGQFLENIARYLGVPLADVGQLSTTARNPERCSSICAVLAETDVINMVSRGISTADILKGIHLSIAGRLVKLLQAIGTEGTVLITGGLALDDGLTAAIREGFAESSGPEVRVRTEPRSILAGALGAALLGAYRFEQLERQGRLPGALA